MVLVLLLVALPLFLIFLVRKYKVNGEILHLPPGPPGFPFIGNLHQMDSSAPHVCLWQLSKQYGPIMSLRLGLMPLLVVSSARMAKETLKAHDLEFSSRPSLLGTQKISYNGLDLGFAPYGEYWREMRKICVVHLFNSKRALSFRSIREDEVSRMIEKISKSASTVKLTNFSEMLMLLTSTIICRIAFGKRYEDDEGCERSRFHGLLNETQAMLGSFSFTDHFPIMGWWVDKLTGMIGRLEKSFKELDLFYQEIIDDHLDPRRPEQEQEDIIDVLLGVKRKRLFSVDLTWDHIKAVLMVS